MADIFISYARADRERVAPLVAALEARGWSVWWDPEITPGQEFDREIAQELDAAKAVIVVWTPRSVDSRWVRGEAREAAERGILVPVRFDGARLPIDARAMQTTDLDGWNGATDGPVYRDLCRALSPLVERRPAHSPASAAAQQARGISICVLPFANMSGDAEQEYFSDGISEDIITDLSKVSALTVISRNSAFTFKGKHVDLPQVARQLKVSHVLEGSVRKSGNRLRITAQLIDGATNGHVWAERYDRDLSDIFALQDEISQAIVGALRLKLLPEEKRAIEQRGTESIAAYDQYLRARSFAIGPQGVKRAAELYREALALDPEFALAWSGLANALRLSLVFFPESSESDGREMSHAMERVRALAPGTAMSYTMQGMQSLIDYEWLGAEQGYAAAIDLANDSTEPLSRYGYVLSILGRHQEAIAAVRAASRTDPLSLGVSHHLQLQMDLAGRREDAEAEYARSKDLQGDRATIEWQAVARMMAPKDARLVRRFGDFVREGFSYMPFDPELLAVLSEPGNARALIRSAFRDPRYQDGARLEALALWATYYGDHDLAFEALRRGFVEMHGQTVIDIWKPALSELRCDPRFKDLVRDLGLYDYWRTSGKWGEHARPRGDDDFDVW